MPFMIRAAALTLLAGLAGCATQYAQPVGNGPVPLVATPGPTKTEAEFRQDDTHCRAQAVQLPPTDSPNSPNVNARVNPAGPYPSGVIYLRCMANAHNTIEPLPVQQPIYTYYEPYPVFVGVGYGYPWFYGYSFSRFGFYGPRFGGYYGHYNYGRYAGFHDGGFRGGYHGGFHGGFHRR